MSQKSTSKNMDQKSKLNHGFHEHTAKKFLCIISHVYAGIPFVEPAIDHIFFDSHKGFDIVLYKANYHTLISKTKSGLKSSFNRHRGAEQIDHPYKKYYAVHTFVYMFLFTISFNLIVFIEELI